MSDVPDDVLDTPLRPLGDGSFIADLHPDWAVADRPHGGYLQAVLTRAAEAGLPGHDLAPLAVSAQYLSAPKIGPVLLRSETLKTGRTVTVVRAVLEQSGRSCVEATVTFGVLPDSAPTWADVPDDMPAHPTPDSVDLAQLDQPMGVYRACDVRIDVDGAGFLIGDTTQPPRLRLWARPRDRRADLLFALIAGDLTVPVTFNLGRTGWTPTVQMTSLLRARPANGWLRLVVDCKAVHGGWFDEDTMVLDSAGRLVCQSRQLALTPAQA
ncbi:thioesterase family protein [Allosaccharopolyspora coralli]|uniref:Thioesterase family protein n=1 Tax=Allosaccharopolyspora coralli TaxID=2665642 RepID=A0A5Q3QAI6_9PSEU|nr:thioesterase family protein [Allosaccharopolyspora coralli]QGK71671.1 thioesterase family protein [Allosaccharopolyspora coralli]